MSSLLTLSDRLLTSICGLALGLLFLAGIAAAQSQQCPVLLHDRAARAAAEKEWEEPLLPEAGYLSFTSYTNLFFAFSFDLPSNVQWQPIMLPVTEEKQHALLAMRYEKGKHSGYLTVIAADPRPGMEVSTPELKEEEAEQMKAWARSGGSSGVASSYALPDYMLHSGHFYYTVRHKGSQYAAQYWTNINNYTIQVVIASNEQDVLRRGKEAMAQARFYCLQDDRTLTTKEGKPVNIEGRPYEGPTVPTFRVNAAIKDQPGRSIPLGAAGDGAYRNPELGFRYDLPQGWQVVPPETSADPPPGDTAWRESQFLHACSQTLLRIAPKTADDAKGPASRPMIVFRVLDPNCLSVRTATRLSDKQATDELAANLEELGEFGQIASDELVTVSGRLFMVFHGTIGSFTAADDLSKRMSQTIFATRYNKLLLVWSFMAPTTAALSEMPTGGITFAGSAPIELRAALTARK
ncbi:MAG: hypothetical protein WA655_06055 [Candidatus Korobacteraceae bacterium]